MRYPPRSGRRRLSPPPVRSFPHTRGGVIPEGDRRTVAKIVDGVLLEVSAYGKNYRNFRAATPKAGEKVVYNTRTGGRVLREDVDLYIKEMKQDKRWKFNG